MVLVAAIAAGVILLIRNGEGQNEAPQLNEELRQELEKDDETQDGTEDAGDGETDKAEEDSQNDDAQVEDTPEPVQTLEPTPAQETPQATPQPQVTEDPVQTVTPTPTEAPEQETVSGDYVLPDSNTSYVTEADLEGLSAWELRVARNEIYARHGRMFSSSDLAEYFAGKSWYEPTVPAESFDESVLNSVEKANLQTILQYEQEHGMNQ